MAAATISSRKPDPPKEFDLRQLIKEVLTVTGSKYLELVSNRVKRHKGERFELNTPLGAVLKIAALEDTTYRDEPDEVNGWGKFYLPDIVEMQVLGVVEGTSCPSEELVLMTCEDKRLFAYDGEELHVVASNLKELQEQGLEYPSGETYYNGQAFEDMNEEDWEEVKRGEVGTRLNKEHEKLVAANKLTFLANLKSQK